MAKRAAVQARGPGFESPGPTEKLSICVRMPGMLVLWGTDKWIPGPHWAVNLGETPSSRFGEKLKVENLDSQLGS